MAIDTLATTIHRFDAESLVGLPASALPPLSQVGGKAWSLMRMCAAGLPVPPGFVLATPFFAPWLASLEASPAWQDFLAALDRGRDVKAACDALKALSKGLTLSDAQADELTAATDAFDAARPEAGLLVVRSSSPEEDLAGASFAGAYETVLGVKADGLLDAIRTAFASCLDARIVSYKLQHGFDPRRPRIAVVVQAQIASESAGVGFSLNPLSNDYDEAVISANFGLGESVVAGLASPDSFVLDKLSLQVKERHCGAKEVVIRLGPDGGTVEDKAPRGEVWAINVHQAGELAGALVRLEALYGQPIDMEWAYADHRLYLLQARPITTWMPLPADMRTEPGAPRRLYGDFTISVQGIFEPLSVMGTSLFGEFFAGLFSELLGEDISREVTTAILFARDGRLYMNLSNALALAGKTRLMALLSNVDSLAMAALAGVDEAAFRTPDYDRRERLLQLLSHLPLKALHALEGGLMPEHAAAGLEHKIADFHADVARLLAQPQPIDDLAHSLGLRAGRLLARDSVPLIALSRVAIAHLGAAFEHPDPETAVLLARLDRSLPHNVTIEMGLALEAAARELLADPDAARYADSKLLAAALASETVPPAFAAAWAAILRTYGHRGPKEIDLAAPRYREQPELLLAQIAQLAAQLVAAQHDPTLAALLPSVIYARSQREREAAFAELSPRAHAQGLVAGLRFDRLYQIVVALGGYRERPKFELVALIDSLRTLVLTKAETLQAAGRLDNVQQVFALTLADLARGLTDQSLDLRALAAANRAPLELLARLPRLPQIFDSRGRIYTAPPRPAREGELAGQAISAGVVTGRVKVLARPDEKPLLAGEILVARATDPGWTPLFVNAAAIVLEVGGLLQHGALVAREYGKPCVAGVAEATSLLRDGELIEVDGGAGLIRRLDAAKNS